MRQSLPSLLLHHLHLHPTRTTRPAVARVKCLFFPTKNGYLFSHLFPNLFPLCAKITPFLTLPWSPVGCSQPTNAFTSDPDSAVPDSRDPRNSEIGARSLTSPPNHWLRIHISSLGWAGGANCFYLSTGCRAVKRGIVDWDWSVDALGELGVALCCWTGFLPDGPPAIFYPTDPVWGSY